MSIPVPSGVAVWCFFQVGSLKLPPVVVIAKVAVIAVAFPAALPMAGIPMECQVLKSLVGRDLQWLVLVACKSLRHERWIAMEAIDWIGCPILIKRHEVLFRPLLWEEWPACGACGIFCFFLNIWGPLSPLKLNRKSWDFFYFSNKEWFWRSPDLEIFPSLQLARFRCSQLAGPCKIFVGSLPDGCPEKLLRDQLLSMPTRFRTPRWVQFYVGCISRLRIAIISWPLVRVAGLFSFPYLRWKWHWGSPDMVRLQMCIWNKAASQAPAVMPQLHHSVSLLYVAEDLQRMDRVDMKGEAMVRQRTGNNINIINNTTNNMARDHQFEVFSMNNLLDTIKLDPNLSIKKPLTKRCRVAIFIAVENVQTSQLLPVQGRQWAFVIYSFAEEAETETD